MSKIDTIIVFTIKTALFQDCLLLFSQNTIGKDYITLHLEAKPDIMPPNPPPPPAAGASPVGA